MLDEGQKVLDRYVVAGRRNDTDAAHVYDAKSEGARDVVIKVLRAGVTERQLRRFEREARMMSQIMHPNVVGLEAFGMVSGNHPALVMQRFEGQSLAERLEVGGSMGWPQAVHLVLGVLSGLESVHAAGVVHRNISPSSILVVEGEHTLSKLINLELAIPAVGVHSRLTWSSEFEQFAAYCAPEVLFDEPATPRSDVFSVAACLYEAISGRRPLQIPNLSSIAKAIDEPIVRPQAPRGRPAVPEKLINAIMAALEKDPAQRTQSARRFADDLRAAHRSAMKVQRKLSAKRRPRLTAHCTVVVTRATDDANTPEEIRAWMESTLGANGWVRVYDDCVVTVVPSEDETRAERIAAALIQTLTDKYQGGVRSVWTPTPGFLMPEAIEAGSLPPVVSEITELLRLEP